MHHFGSFCDQFYINCRLFLKLDLTLGRETVLHFFDRIRKEYPLLKKLRRREDGAILLEEEPSGESSRRWLRLDSTSLRFGQIGAATSEETLKFGQLILTQAPYHLTFSDIEFDHLEVVYGFDLQFRGNHDQLIAETFYADQAANGFMLSGQTAHVIDAQPYFGIALSPDCDLQAYAEVKSRTSSYAVRTGNYDPEPISVFLTMRKYWGIGNDPAVHEVLGNMFELCDDLASEKIVPLFVHPLAAAIASRP